MSRFHGQHWRDEIDVRGFVQDNYIAASVAALSTVECFEVLPFHRPGAAKYTALGIPFPLADVPPSDQILLLRVREQFARHGITIT